MKAIARKAAYSAPLCAMLFFRCDIHDPEGWSTPCCPMKGELEVAIMGSEKQDVTYDCSIYRVSHPSYFGVIINYRHGIERISELCRKGLVEAGTSSLDMDECDKAFLGCHIGGEFGTDGEPLQKGVYFNGGVECHGWVPDPTGFGEEEEHHVHFYPLEMVNAAFTVEDLDEIRVRFEFQAKPGNELVEVIGEDAASRWVLEVAGTCECEPYVAPPESECEKSTYK